MTLFGVILAAAAFAAHTWYIFGRKRADRPSRALVVLLLIVLGVLSGHLLW